MIQAYVDSEQRCLIELHLVYKLFYATLNI